MDSQKILGNIVAVVFAVYITYILTQRFCQDTPSFCVTGWTIFGALVVGAVAYLKFALFK